MRAWLFDRLTTDEALQTKLGADLAELQQRVRPREASETINIPKPYLIYGMGNNTNEDLAEDRDHEAHRQFFQIWIHDEGGDYSVIDEIVEIVKDRLQNASDAASKVTMVRWLETSGEFANETYNTLFRYVRFQAIISKGATT